MRCAEINRNTKETRIRLSLCLDGSGKSSIDSGCGFLDHMLELFARHGDFDLEVKCVGDIHVDAHHSVEDIGICLGMAFNEALGDKRGIQRYGQFFMPMDETLMLCACDLSGRSYLGWNVELPAETLGNFDTELAKEFWISFVRCCPSAVHIREICGENTHHIIEAVFKGMGRCLKQAVSLDAKHLEDIPSTKGML